MMPFWRSLTLVSLFIGGAVATTACESYDSPDSDLDPHSSPIDVGVHADVACDICHVQAATVYQGLSPDADGGWVRSPDGFECGACHPFAAVARQQIITACGPGVDTPWCRYATVGDHQPLDPTTGFTPAACTLCHDPVNHGGWCRAAVCNDIDAHDPELTPEGQAFPLVGGHAGPGCSDCHEGNGFGGLSGYGEQCSNCHLRTDEPSVAAPVGVDHYATPVPPTNPADTERARDCRACHQSLAPDGTVTWPDDWSDTVLHNFVVSHNVAEWPTTGPIPTNPAAWANQCFFCHNQNVNPANLLPTSPVPLDVSYGDFVTSSLFPRTGCTNGCHSEIQGGPADQHRAGLTCSASNCHPVGRRRNDLLPGEPLEPVP